jgi:hypothetical protein
MYSHNLHLGHLHSLLLTDSLISIEEDTPTHNPGGLCGEEEENHLGRTLRSHGILFPQFNTYLVSMYFNQTPLLLRIRRGVVDWMLMSF